MRDTNFECLHISRHFDDGEWRFAIRRDRDSPTDAWGPWALVKAELQLAAEKEQEEQDEALQLEQEILEAEGRLSDLRIQQALR